MPTKQASKPERIARLSVLKSCPVLKHVMGAERDTPTGYYWLTTKGAIKRLSNATGNTCREKSMISDLISELRIDQEGRDGLEKMEKIDDHFVKNFLDRYECDRASINEAIRLRKLRKEKEQVEEQAHVQSLPQEQIGTDGDC